MTVPVPPWLKALPEDEFPAAWDRFMHRLAVLHALPANKVATPSIRWTDKKDIKAIAKTRKALEEGKIEAISLPNWLADKNRKGGENPKYFPSYGVERCRFLLKLAALYCTEAGSLNEMSLALGYSHHTMCVYAGSRDRISVKFCRQLHNHVGRDLFPVSLLNPELFGDWVQK